MLIAPAGTVSSRGLIRINIAFFEDGEIQEQQVFHRFIDPQRDIPPEVVCIHGIDTEKLKEEESAKPFAEICQEFFAFIEGATLVPNSPMEAQELSAGLSL